MGEGGRDKEAGSGPPPTAHLDARLGEHRGGVAQDLTRQRPLWRGWIGVARMVARMVAWMGLECVQKGGLRLQMTTT